MNRSVLYWPGRGQDMSVLQMFLSTLVSNEYEVTPIAFSNLTYDVGALCPPRWDFVSNNRHDWWIGLSLGASLAYYSLKYTMRKPTRITLINPFYSRKTLSHEKGFSFNEEWSISLDNHQIVVEKLEVILSLNDDKIPLHHGIRLINESTCKCKVLIFADTGHTLDEPAVQCELAKLLSEANDYGEYHYCHIYQQR